MLEKFNKYNVWFSVSPGCVIEKNYDMLKLIPLDRLLLESDAPSMFNSKIYESEDEYNYYPKEGDRFKNHPISIFSLSKKLSSIRGIDFNDFKKIIWENNKKLISYLI
jgi:Tat protein secretion system quality control protein TatD with DNase activity